jgi:hypothetical protein
MNLRNLFTRRPRGAWPSHGGSNFGPIRTYTSPLPPETPPTSATAVDLADLVHTTHLRSRATMISRATGDAVTCPVCGEVLDGGSSGGAGAASVASGVETGSALPPAMKKSAEPWRRTRVEFLAQDAEGTLLALHAEPAMFNASGPDSLRWSLYRGDGSQIRQRRCTTDPRVSDPDDAAWEIVEDADVLERVPSLDYPTTSDRATAPTTFDTNAGEFRTDTDEDGCPVFWLSTTRFTPLNTTPVAAAVAGRALRLVTDDNHPASGSGEKGVW